MNTTPTESRKSTRLDPAERRERILAFRCLSVWFAIREVGLVDAVAFTAMGITKECTIGPTEYMISDAASRYIKRGGGCRRDDAEKIVRRVRRELRRKGLDK